MKEYERKFLVCGEEWRKLASPVRLLQGYLSTQIQRSVRIRVGDSKAILNIKGIPEKHRESCVIRDEFEYVIPYQEGLRILEMCEKPLIEKDRYDIPFKGHLWEVDEFLGANRGLVVAEVELKHPDQSFAKPDWIGREVSSDPRYLNVNLIQRPYSTW